MIFYGNQGLSNQNLHDPDPGSDSKRIEKNFQIFDQYWSDGPWMKGTLRGITLELKQIWYIESLSTAIIFI